MLEPRELLAATPVRVTQFFTDNRGQTEVFFNQALNPATLTSKSVRVFGAGADGQFGTGDDKVLARSVGYKKGRLVIAANLAPNTRYRVRLGGIKGTNGLLLDGEFNGMGKWSGNGVAGGNFDITTKNAAKTRARITTVAGFMNLALYTKQAPITTSNFVRYANEKVWDTTFFHRSVPGFVIQGGGFMVKPDNSVDLATSHGNIQNEPGISNTRGTIAMARSADNNPGTTNDRDTASNQWFFNLKSNAGAYPNGLDSGPDEGFTVFGVLTDSASLKVMDAIAKFDLVNAGSPFNELPVRDSAPLAQRNIDPKTDLILVTRVAMMMDAAATPGNPVVRSTSIQPAATTQTVTAEQPSVAGAFSVVAVPTASAPASLADSGVLGDASDKDVFAS
jgi:cyclophilin family peptidyl-prolyl cis-trans isomerase